MKEDFDVTLRVQRGDVTESPGLRPTASPRPVIVESLPVGTYMRGELRGSGFDIEPLSDNLQLFDGVTEWAWRVTPQTDGRRTLRLTLVVELDDVPLSSRTFDRSIDVAVEEQPPWYQRSAGLFDLGGVVTAIAIASILGAAKVGRLWWARRTPTAAASKDAPSADVADVPASEPPRFDT